MYIQRESGLKLNRNTNTTRGRMFERVITEPSIKEYTRLYRIARARGCICALCGGYSAAFGSTSLRMCAHARLCASDSFFGSAPKFFHFRSDHFANATVTLQCTHVLYHIYVCIRVILLKNMEKHHRISGNAKLTGAHPRLKYLYTVNETLEILHGSKFVVVEISRSTRRFLFTIFYTVLCTALYVSSTH